MTIYDFVVPLGIAGLSLATSTVILGFFRKIMPAKPRLLVHRILGLALLGVVLLHGGIVLYFKLFLN